METRTFFFFIIPVLAFAISVPGHAQVYDTTNYHDSSNWAAHPMKGAADMKFFPDYTIVDPDTITKTVVHVDYDTTSGFDIFCIYGTLFIHPLDPDSAQTVPVNFVHKIKANSAILGEFGQYAQFGRIYAPYYRQTNLATFNIHHLPVSERQRQAEILDTAVTDVIGAFDYYMKHDNNGKKVILLGHSQGAILLTMMLRKFESNPTLYLAYLDKIFLSVLVGMESGPYVIKNTLSGGWLQNIPICVNPLDTGCVISWGAHKYGTTFNSIPVTNHIAENDQLLAKDYMYSTLDTTIHEVKMDPLTYNPSSIVSCSIYPLIFFRGSHSDYGVSTNYIGYANMYNGYIGNPDAANFGLLIERFSVTGDKRYDPLDSALGSDFHVWDMYVSSCDVTDLIWQKINQTTTSVSPSEIITGNNVQIFPNPSSDFIKIILSSDFCKKDAIVEIFSSDGLMVKKQELIKSETSIDICGLLQGIYFLKIISGRSIFTNKIVID